LPIWEATSEQMSSAEQKINITNGSEVSRSSVETQAVGQEKAPLADIST